MTTTQQAIAAARRLARFDAMRGKPATDHPYDPNGGPVQQAAARAYVRMSLHMRPNDAGVSLVSVDPDAAPVAGRDANLFEETL